MHAALSRARSSLSRAGARLYTSGAGATSTSRHLAVGGAAAASAAGLYFSADCLKVNLTLNVPVDLEVVPEAAPAYALSLLPPPKNPKYKMCIVGFTAPAPDGSYPKEYYWDANTDKDKTGFRYDSTPIANGIIKAGASCDLINYTPDDHEGFAAIVKQYDGVIVRVNPGQLSFPGVKPGAQMRFDKLMMEVVGMGKPVWSSPAVQTQLGAKDALVCIKDLSCGLPDTNAYYTAADLDAGFKKTCAYQPRVIKQNRGSAGEGIWLCWLVDKDYCKTYGEASLMDSDKLKLMEMNDNHVEYHTVGEFIAFCVDGPKSPKAGTWKSTFPGEYLKGGKEAGGQLVDQRLLPRIKEGEVRMQMVKDELFAIIHKKPIGEGLSAVGGIAEYTFYAPDAPEFADLRAKFESDIPKIMKSMGLENEPLPLFWTGDFIAVDDHVAPYVVGEFNCSCVGISQFGAACGKSKDLSAVPIGKFVEGTTLVDLIGKKAVETLDQLKGK
jgi:hypothetical protein